MKTDETRKNQAQLLPDIEVVRRVLNGEKELYEILMRRNNQKLYRVVRSYLKDDCEVEDAMQNTYLKAYEKLYQFNNEAQFSTWLIRIGINEALSIIRQKEKLKYTQAPQDDITKYNVLQLPDAKSMNPEVKAIHREVQQLLEKAIDDLPTKYKVVYMLKEIEGLSTTEITQALDISESNVKVRLHRAKSMLKETLLELTATQDVFTFGFERCDGIVRKVLRALANNY